MVVVDSVTVDVTGDTATVVVGGGVLIVAGRVAGAEVEGAVTRGVVLGSGVISGFVLWRRNSTGAVTVFPSRL